MKLVTFSTIVFLLATELTGQIHEGVGDFRGTDFSRPVSLDGTYAFYYDQLILPGSFHDSVSAYFPFPSLWNGQVINGEELSSMGCATYRAIVLLPSDSSKYVIHIEDVYSSFALYFNGELVAQNGTVAREKANYKPLWKPMFVALHHARDTNELVLQIANFDHSKGGALEGMELGHAEVMSEKQLQIQMYDLLLTGSLLMGGFFFLGLYFFGRHDKSMLYFALFCIVYSYRIIGVGYYVFHSLVDWPWYITTQLEYSALFLSVFIFGRFVYNLYPQEAPRVVWDVISVCSLVFIGITVLAPPHIYTQLVDPFFGVLMIYLALTFFIYVRAFIRKRPGAVLALLGTGVVFVVFIYNILVYFGWLRLLEGGSFLGYILFFFSQSLVLSFRFAYFLKNARDEAEKAVLAKTDFLSTISHEIRTPLNAVVGMSHFLLQDNPKEHQKESLLSLRYSAEHLTTLINDILDYNKLESGVVTFEELDTNLYDVVLSIYNGYTTKAEDQKLKLNLEFDQSITTGIKTDRTRLSQVLSNLLDNALKFTRKGSVTLRVQKINETSEDITIKYEIVDTGIGIPEDKIDLIFERFRQASSSTTREFGGTGLGLSIIKRLLELQGSQIFVKSTLGVGSVFYFEQTYPIGNANLVKASYQFDENYLSARLAGKRVLLVEDNAMNVMVAEKFLTNWKMVMDLAKNGHEAVSKASVNFYDIILMDLQMPEMDGYEAAREIRSARNPVPILALTASALLQVKQKVLAAGMNDYITKPFDPKELKRKIVKNIRQK